jgi:transcriptional regulator with XRE-family HTH domain
MPKRASTPASELSHRWYFADWAIHLGRRMADAERELGWSRSTASGLWNGTQRYTQERVDEAARWLGLQPYELLMPPPEALQLQRLRDTAYAIAAEQARPFVPARTTDAKT